MDLGLERAGWACRWQVEIDPFRRAVLQKHWPDIPKYGDIRDLTGEELEPVDLVAGGPPCQPVSLAGKRRGKEDDRWLWEETLRIVGRLRPRWCLFENPTGIVSMGLDDVLSALEALGYSCRAAVIPACAVGAPHRRDRVWIVAYTENNRCQCAKRSKNSWRDPIFSVARTGNKDVAHAEGTERQRARAARDGRDGLADGGGRDTQSGVDLLSDGIPPGLAGYRWPAPLGCPQYDWEPPRLAQEKGPYHREQLMALGDAVVPQVVEIIGRAILQVEGGLL